MPLKYWINSIVFAILLWIFFLAYGFFYVGNFTFGMTSESLAGTAGVLIGLSFALSGLSYFFEFAIHKLAYRKYLGLLGYWLALAYTITLAIRFPDKYIHAFPQALLEPEILLGLVAMSILTMMMLISHRWFMVRINPLLWRKLLRLGYFAYFLLVVRAVLVEHIIWTSWINTFQGLPPPRMLLSIYAISIINLRLMMWFYQSIYDKQPSVAS